MYIKSTHTQSTTPSRAAPWGYPPHAARVNRPTHHPASSVRVRRARDVATTRARRYATQKPVSHARTFFPLHALRPRGFPVVAHDDVARGRIRRFRQHGARAAIVARRGTFDRVDRWRSPRDVLRSFDSCERRARGVLASRDTPGARGAEQTRIDDAPWSRPRSEGVDDSTRSETRAPTRGRGYIAGRSNFLALAYIVFDIYERVSTYIKIHFNSIT